MRERESIWSIQLQFKTVKLADGAANIALLIFKRKKNRVDCAQMKKKKKLSKSFLEIGEPEQMYCTPTTYMQTNGERKMERTERENRFLPSNVERSIWMYDDTITYLPDHMFYVRVCIACFNLILLSRIECRKTEHYMIGSGSMHAHSLAMRNIFFGIFSARIV